MVSKENWYVLFVLVAKSDKLCSLLNKKGINAFILRRRGFGEATIENIALAYRQIYQSGTSLENAVLRIKEVVEPSPEIDYILSFIEDSKMGIIATYGEEK